LQHRDNSHILLLTHSDIFSVVSVVSSLAMSPTLPMISLLQRVLKIRELLKKSSIWSNVTVLSDQLQSLGRLHLVLHDEVGSDHASGPGPAHDAVDHH